MIDRGPARDRLAGQQRPLGLHWREVELSAEIEAVVQLLASALQEAGFTMEVDLHVGRVGCDPQRIRQALLALLETPAATPSSASFASNHVWRKASACCASNEDGGPGIAPELAERPFDAFQRGEHHAAERGGSGPGLAVVRAIAQAHGGQRVAGRPARRFGV